MKTLMESEKRGIRDKAKAELEELVSNYNNIVDSQRVVRFKTAFKICEKIYFVVLKPHQIAYGRETSNLKINMTQGRTIFRKIGYNFDEKLLKRLFNSSKFEDKNTAKMLFERLNEKNAFIKVARAEEELADREKEIFGYIDEFLKEIREHDETS